MSMVTVSKVDSSIKYIPFWDPWLGTRESVHMNSVVTDGDLKLEPNDRRVQEQTTLEHMRLRHVPHVDHGVWCSTLCRRQSLQIRRSFRACLGSERAPFCRHLVHCSILAWAPACSTLLTLTAPSEAVASNQRYLKVTCFALFYNVLHVSQKLLAMEKANSSKGCSMNKHSKSQSLWGSGRTISCFVPSSRNSEKTRICWLRPIGISWTFT